MSNNFIDEFDEFCKLAKNPSGHSPHFQRNASDKDNTNMLLNRSRSVRERPIPRLYISANNNTGNQTSAQANINSSNEIEENKIVRVRSFRRTTKGVVCNKDTFEFREDLNDSKYQLNQPAPRDYLQSSSGYSLKKTALNSQEDVSRKNRLFVAETSHVDNSNNQSSSMKDSNSSPNINDSNNTTTAIAIPNNNNEYFVQILGTEYVGKTSLIQHLLVPEYLNFQYQSNDEENNDHIITIFVDNRESILHLLDCDSSDFQTLAVQPQDACLIMYAIDDRCSFDACRKTLANIVLINSTSPVVMLIGNKADLVRSRVVSLEEGKRLASVYNLKFKEISLSIDHCVDELLVSLVTELRYNSGSLSLSGKSGPGRMLQRINRSQLRHSLRNKVSHNAVSRFFQKHFNKSYDNVNHDNN